MRIAMIGSKGIPAVIGGVERHVEELSACLAARGFAVTAYARPWYTQRAPWSERTHRGVRVVTLPSIPLKHLDAISHTLLATWHAMRERHDIYHFHGVGPALCAWIPRLLRPNARVVVTFHCVDRHHAKWGWFARTMLTLGERAACMFPHETITVGETLEKYCADRYGRETTCIPNGVTSTLKPSGIAYPLSLPLPQGRGEKWGGRSILEEFGLVPQKYLLVVSRLVPHKGVHTVIAAFRTLQREHREFRGLQLAIVGAPAFTEAYVDELHVQAAGDPSIRFLGQQVGATLDTLYRHCLAFVHASSSEGLPIAVLEAAAAGAVPIVSDIPEHCEVIDRVGGFCFRTGDVHDCVRTIDVVLRSAASLPRIGKDIQRSVLRHYDWETAAARTAARYRAMGATERPSVRRRAMRLRFAV